MVRRRARRAPARVRAERATRDRELAYRPPDALDPLGLADHQQRRLGAALEAISLHAHTHDSLLRASYALFTRRLCESFHLRQTLCMRNCVWRGCFAYGPGDRGCRRGGLWVQVCSAYCVMCTFPADKAARGGRRVSRIACAWCGLRAGVRLEAACALRIAFAYG